MLLENMATLFLTPSGVLVAALGVASTEPLKTGVSAIGFLLAALWTWSTIGVDNCPTTNFECSLLILPWMFVFLWGVSLAVHASRWFTTALSFAKCERQ